MIGCPISLYYHVGVAFVLTKQYVEASKALSSGLLLALRTKALQVRLNIAEEVAKKSDQMCALLALCVSLVPFRLEESVSSLLRDKFEYQMNRIHQQGTDVGDILYDLFSYGMPKVLLSTQVRIIIVVSGLPSHPLIIRTIRERRVILILSMRTSRFN